MNDLLEQYRAQIECLQNELAKKTTLINDLRNLITEFENEIKTENKNLNNSI